MITYLTGDLLSSPAQTLVNTVNSVGVMGKGIAKSFKAIYPEMFAAYRQRCEAGELTIGSLFLYRSAHKWVLNFPTKRHWRQGSRPQDIAAGLETFRRAYAEHGITSIAFPQLGCGNGGLDWESQVRPMMERQLGDLPIAVYIHIRSDMPAPVEAEAASVSEWLRHGPRFIPFPLVWQELQAIVAAGEAPRWSVSESSEAIWLDLSERSIVVTRSELADLWRRFYAVGYLVLEDVALTLDAPPEPVLDLLDRLPYVTPARVAPLACPARYDGCLTRALLVAPGARGVQLVPPLMPADAAPVTSWEWETEDTTAWNENPTIGQLALFLTS